MVVVRLGRTKTGDDDLARLEGLTRLEELNLGNTSITDAGLEHLKALKNLKMLSLVGTRVSSLGVKALQRICRVDLHPVPPGGGHVSLRSKP